MTNLNKLILSFISIILLVTTISCKSKNDEPTPPGSEQASKTILIYMIGTNNLNSFMETDIVEIFNAAELIDLEKYNILIYEHGTKSGPFIYKIIRKNGVIEKKILKSYLNTVSSATSERMSSVINDMQEFAPAEKYGLILWSHALGWIQGSSPKKLIFDDQNSSPLWYGDDYGTKMDIDDVALSIPDNLFDFIWMDCCYMSTIEFIYQIRNKCNWFIGYPTEILADGMPYDQTLPLILNENSDIIAAAEATFNYYFNHVSSQYQSCTIAVIDMSEIENIAYQTKKILANAANIETSTIQQYSRGIPISFYDFGDYIRTIAESQNMEVQYNEFKKILNRFIIYKAATSKFLNIKINPDKYFGISIHILKHDGSSQEEYYKTLDWYKTIYLN